MAKLNQRIFLYGNIGVIDDVDFSNYEINDFGQVINITTTKLLKPSISAKYYNICLTSKNNKNYMKKMSLIILMKIN